MPLHECAVPKTELLPLTIAFTNYDRTRPLVDGSVVPAGIAPKYVLDGLGRAAARPVYEEFDVAEMGFAWYCAARDRGEPVIALPIFPLRMPVLSYMFVRSDSPITSPRQLGGKKIGVLGYRFTVNLWLRGIVQDHYGVKPDEMSWISTLANEGAGFVYPDGLDISIIPDAIPQELLLDGVVDAVFSPTTLPGILDGDPRLRRLFTDPRAELAGYYAKTNILPIMQTIVVSETLLAREPWIADRLLTAFREAQRVCDDAYLEPKYLSPFDAVLSLEAQRRDFGRAQYVHGLKRNRHIVATFVRYAYEQGYITKLPDVDALFAAVTDD